jgi:hypothetical protein
MEHAVADRKVQDLGGFDGVLVTSTASSKAVTAATSAKTATSYATEAK